VFHWHAEPRVVRPLELSSVVQVIAQLAPLFDSLVGAPGLKSTTCHEPVEAFLNGARFLI
jgi:hypothetical protein